MSKKQSSNIKRSQKESLYTREVAQLMWETALDDKRIAPLSVMRVKLSPDAGLCTIYFYAPNGQEQFDEILPFLVLYKNSLRRALAKKIDARYTPDLLFKFDIEFQKQKKIEDLIDKLKKEDSSS